MIEWGETSEEEPVKKANWWDHVINVLWVVLPSCLLLVHEYSDSPDQGVRNLITVFSVLWFLGGIADVFIYKVLDEFLHIWVQVSWKPHVYLGAFPFWLSGSLGMWVDFAFYLIGYLCAAFVRKSLSERFRKAGVSE